jgi:hypothetical protein
MRQEPAQPVARQQSHTNPIRIDMNYEEAIEWLNGNRSHWDHFACGDHREALLQCTEADAWTTQQAYWIVKAHKEGLLNRAAGVECGAK